MALFTTVRQGDLLEVNGSRMRVTKVTPARVTFAVEVPTDIRVTRPDGSVRSETTKDRAKPDTQNP